MPINNNADLTTALRSGKSQYVYLNKSSQTNQAVGLTSSYWRSAGHPPAGDIPTSAEICDETTLGGLIYKQPSAGKILYIGEAEINFSTNGHSLIVSDRLAQMGGLDMSITTVQTVSVDIGGSASNLADRRGDYSEVMWWLQCYVALGATIVTVTVNYTAHDDSVGSVTVTLPASVTVHRMTSIPRPADGKYIKRIESIQLNTSTGTAGNAGVTATRFIAHLPSILTNAIKRTGPMELGLPVIRQKSCLEVSSHAIAGSPASPSFRLRLLEV